MEMEVQKFFNEIDAELCKLLSGFESRLFAERLFMQSGDKND